MPTYVAHCPTCGHEQDYIRSISNRNDTPICCEAPMVKGLTAPAISAMAFTGHKGFHMPDGKHGGKGTWIESGQDYKRYLRENNKIPSSEAAAEARIQKKHAEAADTQKRREAVVKAIQHHSK